MPWKLTTFYSPQIYTKKYRGMRAATSLTDKGYEEVFLLYKTLTPPGVYTHIAHHCTPFFNTFLYTIVGHSSSPRRRSLCHFVQYCWCRCWWSIHPNLVHSSSFVDYGLGSVSMWAPQSEYPLHWVNKGLHTGRKCSRKTSGVFFCLPRCLILLSLPYKVTRHVTVKSTITRYAKFSIYSLGVLTHANCFSL
jgi:hypothetical protein